MNAEWYGFQSADFGGSSWPVFDDSAWRIGGGRNYSIDGPVPTPLPEESPAAIMRRLIDGQRRSEWPDDPPRGTFA